MRVDVYAAIENERVRAHHKYGETSMRHRPLADPVRLGVLVEEIGEVARVLNDARHSSQAGPDRQFDLMYEELIQVAAAAVEWAEAIARVRHDPVGVEGKERCEPEEWRHLIDDTPCTMAGSRECYGGRGPIYLVPS